MSIDLHTHSTASDGTRTPEAVVDWAAACGCTVLALTDHDSIDGVEPAAVRARELGIELIPAIEINTDVPGKEIHVLGYYLDIANDQLLTFLADRRKARVRRLELMVTKLRAAGIGLDADAIAASANGGTITRSHIAQAMVQGGYVPDMQTALKCYLQPGGPAYVARDAFSPVDAVKLILAAGGVPVLAHPGLYAGEELLPSCLEAGLKGIEVYYRAHTADQVRFYHGLARQHGLLETGGTDCHGPGTYRDLRIGDVEVPATILPPLREAAANGSVPGTRARAGYEPGQGDSVR